MGQRFRTRLFVCTAILALSACDGGSTSGLNFASAPGVFPAPSPTPTPTPTPTSTPAPFGLTYSQQFATFGLLSNPDASPYKVEPTQPDQIKFAWSAEDKTYLVTVPGFAASRLQLTFPGNNPVAYNPVQPNGEQPPLAFSVATPAYPWLPGNANLKFSYSSLVHYQTNPPGATDPFIYGIFAYGIPTSSFDVPKTGTATYDAQVVGFTTDGDAGYDITGTAQLVFDFGAGSLSGYMRARMFSDWDGIDSPLPQYDFTQTSYSTGSTTFSGKFNVPNAPTDSAFTGQFTGPQAAELIAGWRAPYLDPFDNKWHTMGGVWLGKKH